MDDWTNPHPGAIRNQDIRNWTPAHKHSTALNYGEARGAESRTDFVHKLKIVLKELNETAVWLQLIPQTNLLSADKIIPLITENAELCRIIAASISDGEARPIRNV